MDMGGGMDAAAGTVLLGLPWLLLALVAWRSARRPRAFAHLEQPVSVIISAPTVEFASVTPQPDSAEAVSPPTPPTPLISEADQEGALLLTIAAAKAVDDDAVVSSASVELARLLIARSARQDASQHLHAAVVAARRSNLPGTHAAARIELAELAYRDGDLTTACEHWQMAKLMFHETGRRTDRDRVADVMRQHRCPTDWVLTNF
jgi:hypothetical protein